MMNETLKRSILCIGVAVASLGRVEAGTTLTNLQTQIDTNSFNALSSEITLSAVHPSLLVVAFKTEQKKVPLPGSDENDKPRFSKFQRHVPLEQGFSIEAQLLKGEETGPISRAPQIRVDAGNLRKIYLAKAHNASADMSLTITVHMGSKPDLDVFEKAYSELIKQIGFGPPLHIYRPSERSIPKEESK
jgi:hypothetical protein